MAVAVNGDDSSGGATRALPATQAFVGRSDALAVLDAEFRRAADGDPRVVWVQGMPGIGKTRLVRRFVERAPAHRLVWASGDEDERSLTFGVVDQIRAALDEAAPAGGTMPIAPGPPGDALLAGGHVLALLGSVRSPVVLVVDDLHLADRESLQALLFAVRRLRVEPLLVVLTSGPHADAQWGPGWRRLLADPARVTTVQLAGLTPDDLVDLTTALGHPRPTHAVAERLHEHTNGHPLHFRSLLEEVGVSGLSGAQGVPPSPRSLAALVTSRVVGLPEPAQDLLAAGAVLGKAFDPALAAQIADAADPAGLLDLIARAGLVESPSGAQAVFTHPLVHSAVYHGLPPSRRRTLHAAAASRTSGDIAAQHRVFATSGFDAELAAEFDARAQRELFAGRGARAAGHWHTASRLAPEAADRERMLLRAVALWCAVGEAGTAAGLRAAVEACADGFQRTLVLAMMDLARGRITQASSLLQAMAGADPAEVGEPWWTYALVVTAPIRLVTGDYVGAVAAADRVMLPGLWQERALAEWCAMVALAHLDDSEAVRARADRLADLERNNPAAADLVVPRGAALLIDDDVSGAASTLGVALGRMTSGHAVRLPELLLTDLAEAEFRLGRWSDAVLHLDLAIAAARDGTHSFILVRAHALWVWICAARGDFADARRHLDAAEGASATYRSPLSRRVLATSRALLADALGDAPAMLQAMSDAVPGGLDATTANSGLPNWRAVAVEALVRAGPAGLARDALDRYAAWIATRDHGTWTDHLARLRVLSGWSARGATDEAERLRAMCARQLERSPRGLSTTLPRARLHHVYGRLLLDGGQLRGAVEQFRAARQIFAALHALPFLAQCDADLAACGLPTRPARAGGGPLALTDAEAKVASLVADGLSNREVAQQLYLSQKTVEYHLGHIFTKLGVTSRARLARALAVTPALSG